MRLYLLVLLFSRLATLQADDANDPNSSIGWLEFIKSLAWDLFKYSAILSAVVIIGAGLFLISFTHYTNRNFSRWSYEEKYSYICKWYYLYMLLYGHGLIRSNFYSVIQNTHHRNCQVCNGKKDAFQCVAHIVNSHFDAQFIVREDIEMGGEERDTDSVHTMDTVAEEDLVEIGLDEETEGDYAPFPQSGSH